MCIRNEESRPYLIRKDSEIINLNGKWEFEFDDFNIGHKDFWFKNKKKFSKEIEVPFPFQSKLSGINDPKFHDYIWYKKNINLTLNNNKRYILNFNGVDYESEIYVNGNLVKNHIGAINRFKVDITNYLVEGDNSICVYACDDSISQDFPRGKQYWEEKSKSIFYTRTSGIYKNVYLEILNNTYIDEYYITPDIDKGEIKVTTLTNNNINKIEYIVYLENKQISHYISEVKATKRVENCIVIWDKNDIFNGSFHHEEYCWTPENPCLYDIIINVYSKTNILLDSIKTYFGMRKVSYEDGIFKLNNRPYYQKLVLIQGYFKDGLLTYPSEKALIDDIKAAKELGFNGGRIHQKVEDPLFYYLCDKLGFIAWLECPSGQVFNEKLITLQVHEWVDAVKQNYNHPSIFTLVPLNESWGVPSLTTNKREENYQSSLYYLTKAIDASRLVVGNDGWEITYSDICSIHNYRHGDKYDLATHKKFYESLQNKEILANSCPGNRTIYLKGYKNKDVPYMLTEFGGISLRINNNNSDDWGYSEVSETKDFIDEYKRIIEAINDSTGLCGYCYTQLYDVEQEVNGLLTYDRKFKVDAKKIKEINDLVSKTLIFTK